MQQWTIFDPVVSNRKIPLGPRVREDCTLRGSLWNRFDWDGSWFLNPFPLNLRLPSLEWYPEINPAYTCRPIRVHVKYMWKCKSSRLKLISQLTFLIYLQISQRLKDSIKSSADADISISEYTLSTSDYSESLFVSNGNLNYNYDNDNLMVYT